VPKFPGQERKIILNIVANLSIKRVSDSEIIGDTKANKPEDIKDNHSIT
jgi:hypothetical protein